MMWMMRASTREVVADASMAQLAMLLPATNSVSLGLVAAGFAAQ
jgi:hypothetical protein